MLTLKQHAYRIIRDKLLNGTAEPGSRLSDDLLARELGISRGPVREALSQLASEGLVDHRPRCGFFVKQPDLSELEELYEIREALERYAAHKVALHISTESLVRLRQLCKEMYSLVQECETTATKPVSPELLRRFLSNDLAFHTIILEAAGNSRLTKLVLEFKILLQIFSFLATEPELQHDLQDLIKTYRSHRRITQSLQKRDAKAAGVWMARHIRGSRARMYRQLGKLLKERCF